MEIWVIRKQTELPSAFVLHFIPLFELSETLSTITCQYSDLSKFIKRLGYFNQNESPIFNGNM